LAGVELSGLDGFSADFSDEAGLSDGLVLGVLSESFEAEESESFEAEESEDLSVSLGRLSFL
tara:strand:- start:902 stop:1087 length:186 start_codon:yes stop_codon:yes gene_type:complete